MALRTLNGSNSKKVPSRKVTVAKKNQPLCQKRTVSRDSVREESLTELSVHKLNNLEPTMKNENEVESKTTKAKKLIANIIEKDKMLDIYTFVHNKAWKHLEFSSLNECVDENLQLPCYSKMRRIYTAVTFQKTYLPDTEVGDIKEGVLRPICAGNHTDVIKTRVAAMILKSEKGLDKLKKKRY